MSLLSGLIIIAGFLFSALFSGVETGSYLLNRIRLKRWEREQRPAAVRLGKVLRNSHIFIFTVLIGNNLAVYLLSKEVTDLFLASGMSSDRFLLGFIPWNAETVATLSLMFPLFLFAEVGPKNLFRIKADVLMYQCAGIMQFLIVIFYPFTWPLRQLFRLLTRGADSSGRDLHRLSPDALKEYFSVGRKEGVISFDQNRMVENVTSMHRVRIRELMTPFHKLSSLPESATVGDFKRLVSKTGTAEVLLTQRQITIGIVSLYELVNRKLSDSTPLKPYVEELLSVRDNRNLKSVFYRLRRNPHHCAIVTDSRGHSVGFVRLEDIGRYIIKK